MNKKRIKKAFPVMFTIAWACSYIEAEGGDEK